MKERLKGRAIDELDEIIHACLQPQPQERPREMLGVKRAIDKARQRYPRPLFTDENRMAAPSPVRKRR
ncbi:MAG: hypothetical protein HC813_02550 [Planctomycetes bacterium]|nr:hypothetical protein [Planctomycetota bacterium]